MRIGYSPYEMCSQAIYLINKSSSKDDLYDNEHQIICLLNEADTFPNMSKYQLAMAHKELADLYFKLGFMGSALEHYELGVELYPKLSVKRKIAEIKKLNTSDLLYSLDPNIADEPDYSSLTYYNNDNVVPHIERQTDYDNIRKKVMDELKSKAEEDDKIYDQEFEDEIEERLSKLDELSRSEFYRLRTNRKSDGILSSKKLDLLTLEAMERSFNYRNNNNAATEKRISKEFSFGGTIKIKNNK